jgi:hypothetical protein
MGRRAAIGVIDELYETALEAPDRTLADMPAGFPDEIAHAIAEAARQRMERLPSAHEATTTSSSTCPSSAARRRAAQTAIGLKRGCRPAQHN